MSILTEMLKRSSIMRGDGPAAQGYRMPARGEPKGPGETAEKRWAGFLKAADASSKEDWSGRDERIQTYRNARKHLPPVAVSPEIAKIQAGPVARDHSVENLNRHAQGWFAQKLPTPHQRPLDPSKPEDAECVVFWITAVYAKLFGFPGNVYAKFTDALPGDAQGIIKILLKDHRWHIRQRHRENDSGEDEEFEEADKASLERVDRPRRDYFPFFAEHVDSKGYRPLSSDDDG